MSESSTFSFFKTVNEMLDHRAHNDCERIAFTFLSDGESLEENITYGALHVRALIIASELRKKVQAGERAMLLYPSGLDFIAAFFGCIYAGVIPVPAYPPIIAKPTDPIIQKILLMVRDADARCALSVSALMPLMENLLQTIPSLKELEWIMTDECAGIPLQKDDEARPGTDDISYLQYTSGSTSQPKGVMVTHGNILSEVHMMVTRMGKREHDLLVGWLPFFHDAGLIGNILMPMYAGFRAVLFSTIQFLQKPIRWLNAFTRYGGTISSVPNFAYELCVNRVTPDEIDGIDLSTWTLAGNGSEPVRHETMEEFAKKFGPCGFSADSFTGIYGLAEATLLISGGFRGERSKSITVDADAMRNGKVRIAGGEAGVHSVSMGPVLDYQKVVIVNPDTMDTVKGDEIGEIWVSGPNVARGYWNRENETGETFAAYVKNTGEGPFLRTGDLGFFHGGELHITGRIKDVIIINGENHYPQDIEFSVSELHPLVRKGCCAALSIADNGKERLAIVVEAGNGFNKDRADEAVTAICDRVFTYHGISVGSIVFIKKGSMLKTTSGKIQRSACKKAYAEGGLKELARWQGEEGSDIGPFSGNETSGAAAGDVPGGRSIEDIERLLLVEIAAELRVSPSSINKHQKLSRCGLNSISAVTIAARLQDLFGIAVSPVVFFEHPTVDGLSRALHGEIHGLAEKDVGGRSGGTAQSPIAIIGMSCRFPGAESKDEFWDMLVSGKDGVARVPEDRPWYGEYPGASNTADRDVRAKAKVGGFLGGIDMFDNEFFGVTPREAERMDPQQRILLELAWHAFEDAGIPAIRAKGTGTGVFIGICGSEYGQIYLSDIESMDGYTGTGFSPSIAANRISYLFDLHGPSLAVDTACSSSLVAVHQAVRSIRTGECGMALAGGVNLVLGPHVSIYYSHAGILSHSGRCRPFDASADGIVRSDGAGLVLLKPLADALRDGDRVYAVIRGSAVNHGGTSMGLTAPNPLSQEMVLREAHNNAGIPPGEIGYVEAHGTGTLLGDPIEARALSRVITADERKGDGCALGSVKGNIGHAEAAAGIAGLIKTALMLKNRTLVPTVHYSVPNPHIPFETMGLAVQKNVAPWKGNAAGHRYAGVSSFGIGGTNAHLVIEGPPPETNGGTVPRPDDVSHGGAATNYILPLSAGNRDALRYLARSYTAYLKKGAHDIRDVCGSASRRRTHHRHRLSVAAPGTDALLERLEEFLRNGSAPSVFFDTNDGSVQVKLGFIFYDTDPDLRDVSKELYLAYPAFRGSYDATADCIDTFRGMPAGETHGEEKKSAFREIGSGAPSVLAVHAALADLFAGYGIIPRGVAGCGCGKISAAYAARIINRQEAVALVYAENMPSVARAGEETAFLSAKGSYESNDRLSKESGVVASEGITEPVRYRSGGESTTERPQESDCLDYSPVTGPALNAADIAADYWKNDRRDSENLNGAVARMIGDGFTHFVEVGSNADPSCRVCEIVEKSGKKIHAIQFITGDNEGRDRFFDSMAELYASGYGIDFSRINEGGNFIDLPLYPFQRSRFWAAAPCREAHDAGFSADDLLDAVTRESAKIPAGLDLMEVSLQAEHLKRLTNKYILSAFNKWGAFARKGERHTAGSIIEKAGIKTVYWGLVERWLAVLSSEGVLSRCGDEYSVSGKVVPADGPGNAFDPDSPMLAFIESCGTHLAGVLEGTVNPLDLLFPGGSYRITDYLYHEWPVARYFNNMASCAAEHLCREIPHAMKLSIIEIGAGTGGTTRSVLPLIQNRTVEYWFTDVSGFFFSKAREKFSEYRQLRYGVLDIEKDPDEQGFPKGSFDMVIAGNSLHAARDIVQAARNVRSLLSDNGVLILYEATTHFPWYDFTTGLIEGWQRFDDSMRTDCPLMSAERWRSLLLSAGFLRAESFPPENEKTAFLGQHVLIATASENIRPEKNRFPRDNAFSVKIPFTVSADPEKPLPAHESLADKTPEDRESVITEYILGELAGMLGVPAALIDTETSFMELGLDSLMAVELKGKLDRIFGTDVPLAGDFGELSVKGLVEKAAAVFSENWSEKGMEWGDESEDSRLVPITPPQGWFFSHRLDAPGHWNIAFVLDSGENLEPSRIEQAFSIVASHHDAIGVRIVERDGRPYQKFVKKNLVDFSIVDISRCGDDERKSRVEAAAASAHGMVDVNAGPLMRGILFKTGPDEYRKLFFAVHHLAMDGFSQILLIQDLNRVYSDLARSGTSALPPAPVSYRDFSRRMYDFAQTGEMAAEAGRWLSLAGEMIPKLTVDNPGGACNEGSYRSIFDVLPEEETGQLFGAASALSIQPHELVLAAFFAAYTGWAASDALFVEYESHGRSRVTEMDLSRTLGWCNIMFPLLIRKPAPCDAASLARNVAAALGSCPGDGIGYGLLRYCCDDESIRTSMASIPEPEVKFLYHGRLIEQIGRSSGIFTRAAESPGPLYGPGNIAKHKLYAYGGIIGGGLHVSLCYSENLFREETVRGLMERYMMALRGYIGGGRSAVSQEEGER